MEAAGRNAAADRLPSEIAADQRPNPQLADVAPRVAQVRAEEALDANPAFNGRAGAEARGKAEAVRDWLGDEPTPLTGEAAAEDTAKLLAARKIINRKSLRDRPYSYNLTRTADSFALVVEAARAERGKLTAESLWRLVATLYGPPIADGGGLDAIHGSGLSYEPLKSGLATFFRLWGKGKLRGAATIDRVLGVPPEDAQFALRFGLGRAEEAWQASVAEAKGQLLRAPRSKEYPVVDRGLTAYLASMKAAEAAGYKWREPIFEGRQSQDALWLDALSRAQMRPGFTVGEVLGEDRVPRLARAYEVLNGLGGNGARAHRYRVVVGLGVREGAQAEALPMTGREAREIVEAWESGDFGRIDEALGASKAPFDSGVGHETAPDDPEATAGAEPRDAARPTFERVKDLLRPDPKLYRALGVLSATGYEASPGGPRRGVYSLSVDGPDGVVIDRPEAMLEAREILDSTPRAILLAAEHAVYEGAARHEGAANVADAHVEAARDLMAYQWARVLSLGMNEGGSRYGLNGRFGDLAVEFLRADLGESAATTEAGNRIVDAVFHMKRALARLARTQGWIVEEGGQLEASPDFMRRVTEVQHDFHREFGEQLRKPHPFEDEGHDPLGWMCGSPCAWSSTKLADEAKAEAEAEFGPSKRLTKVWRNLTKALSLRRSVLATYATQYAREFRDPSVRTFSDSFLRRWTGNLRDRFGDTIANVLGKSNDLYHSLSASFAAKHLDIHREAGYTLSADPSERPSFEDATPKQRQEGAELAMIARALDGREDPAALPQRAFKAYTQLRALYGEARRVLVGHIFREVTAEADRALADGRDMAGDPLRKFRRVFGDLRDPRQVKDIVEKIAALNAGETATLHGRALRGWGIRDYHPHLFGPEASKPSAADMEQVRVAWLDGQWAERWKARTVEDYARRHGFMSSHRRMRSLMSRITGADGWVEDSLWAGTGYFENLARKVSYDRSMADLQPLVFGDWRNLKAESAATLADEISNITDERPDGAFGAVDPYFGVRFTGKIADAGIRVNIGGKWIKPEKGELPTKARRLLAAAAKTGQWRRNRAFERLGPDLPPEDLRLAFSDGRTTIILRGLKAIERAGVQRRDGGLIGYKTGEQYAAIKETIRKATGFDFDTGKLDPGKFPGKFAAGLEDTVQAVSRFLYHAQLGGVVNPKAFAVQAVDGLLHNFAVVGGKETLEAQKDFGGFHQFWAEVIAAKEPTLAYDAALKKYAATPYVRLIRPIMEASGMKLNEALRTEKQLTPSSARDRLVSRLDRTSFLSFQLADLHAKETAYYAAFKKFVDAGQTVDPESGRVTKIVPEAIPLGDLFKYGRDTVSAHDLARGVMERAQFTQPRWAMPAFVQLPGWPIVGHLGTIAANVTTSFWKGAADVVRYTQTGDAQYLPGAQQSVRYLVAIGAAYWLARLFGRDLGSYVGDRPADVGYGEYRLGKMLPFLHALPDWVRVPAWQLPEERSMPMKLFLSEKPEEGVPAMFGDAVLRMSAGDGAAESIGDAFKPWWNNWSRSIGLGPWTRSGRPILAALNSQRSDLDPERPYAVRDPSWFGPDGKTRYRDAFDTFFGDIFLPGYSVRDSAAGQRIEWERMKADVRGRTGAVLRKDLLSNDPDVRQAAYRELTSRGFTVEDWRLRKQGMLDDLPSQVRRGIGVGSTRDKLEVFAGAAADWPPQIRRLALRYILPLTPGKSPSGVSPELWGSVQAALNAPWGD